MLFNRLMMQWLGAARLKASRDCGISGGHWLALRPAIVRCANCKAMSTVHNRPTQA